MITHSGGGTPDKEDFKILTAWIEVNHPNKPALREPVQCIRLSTYEQTVRVLVAAQSAMAEKDGVLTRALAELSVVQSALAVANSRNQEEIEADRAMTRALALAETAGVGGQCATCSFRYWEHKGHIIPCPLCRAEAAEARAGEAR